MNSFVDVKGDLTLKPYLFYLKKDTHKGLKYNIHQYA
jgi:hypothetical protein